MKVSRKVGRRKHSRGSSISRRRFRNNKNKKSSYKKRYTKTHRGGCWSAKKGGARSRKYGHKRGKRFHRGGHNFDYFSETEFSKPIIRFISDNTENPSRIYRLANDLQLRYNKLFYPFTTSTFTLTFYILLDFHDSSYIPKVCMTLTRSGTDGQDSLIFVKLGSLTDVLKYLKQFYSSDSITESGYMFNIMSTETGEQQLQLQTKTPNIKTKDLKKYNFSYKQNQNQVDKQIKLFTEKLKKLLGLDMQVYSKSLLDNLQALESTKQPEQSTSPPSSSSSGSTYTNNSNYNSYSTDGWGGAQKCYPANYYWTKISR